MVIGEIGFQCVKCGGLSTYKADGVQMSNLCGKCLSSIQSCERQMEHIKCDEEISALRSEKGKLLDLMEAAFSDLNQYWQDDFENRGLAVAMKEALERSGRSTRKPAYDAYGKAGRLV